MSPTHSTNARAKRHLFLGSAAGALACAIAALPAQAQTTHDQTMAAKSLVNDQINQGVRILTETGNAQLTTVIAGTTDASSIALSGNDVSMTARGNRVIQDLESDASDPASAFSPTFLATGTAGVTGNAATLIASRQANNGSEVIANNKDSVAGTDSAITVVAGELSASKVAVTANTQQAAALGNDASATLATNDGSGAGIVSLQTGDAGSDVAARSFGTTGITAQDVRAGDLAVTGNLGRGIAYGNTVDNQLTARPAAIEAPATAGIASAVPAIGDGDPTTNAAYAILSTQADAGVVKARSGGGDGSASGLVVTGDAEASSLTNDGNALVAAGYGNHASNSLDLDAASIARPAPNTTGAIANVTGVQSLADTARIVATTSPGTITHVYGAASGSILSVSDNSNQTIATGNLASGNLLTIEAATIDAHQGDPLGGGVAGTALTTPAGDASVTAASSVQNVQDYGKASIFAGSIGNAAGLEVGGTVTGSTLHDDGNTSTGAATGNSATNAASLDATTIATSAGVNTLQTGDGNVSVLLGSSDHRAGATLSAQGPVTGSTMSVANNQAIGTATANTSHNSLAISADTLLDGSGHGGGQAGPIANGYGAAATFALANEQKTGVPSSDSNATPAIAANVTGRFAIDGDGWADHSSLAVDDNLEQAGALANDSVNRLSIAATGTGDGDARPVGAALSSSQYGRANVTASSEVKFVAFGATNGSAVSLSRDTNEAMATINQADNGLSISGVRLDGVTGGDADIASEPRGAPIASGNNVLANQQFATGSATAFAGSRYLNGDVSDGVGGSRFTIADNVTSADAAANRALNGISVTGAAGPAGNAGLVNSQINAGDVTASAIANAAFTVAGTTLAPISAESEIAIDGNQTVALARANVADNHMVLDGAGLSNSAAVAPFDAAVHAAGALLNSQASYGAVSATASNSSYGIPLNGAGVVSGSTLGVTGNSISAAAFGNIASNAVSLSALGQFPSAAVANVQTNYGPVTAQVTGATFRITSGQLSAAALSITGNQLAATATGNQATNLIAAQR